MSLQQVLLRVVPGLRHLSVRPHTGSVARPLLRRTILPWAVFLGTGALAAYLWRAEGVWQSQGYLSAEVHSVASTEPGRIAKIYFKVGATVEAGEVIAELDAGPLNDELALLEAERVQTLAEIGARDAAEVTVASLHAVDFAGHVDAAEVALADARAERAEAEAELTALNRQLAEQEQLLARHLVDRRGLDELQLKAAGAQAQVRAKGDLIRKLEESVRVSRQGAHLLPAQGPTSQSAPLHARLSFLESQKVALEHRRAALLLRAPVTGELVTLPTHVGEVVAAGAPVATMVSEAERAEVRICLSSDQSALVRPGDRFVARGPQLPASGVSGHVIRVSRYVGELPIRCRRDKQVPEWGSEASARLDLDLQNPGASFQVQFDGTRVSLLPEGRERVETGVAAAEPAQFQAPAMASATAPLLLHVPRELARETRFEPSGLVWAPELDRYLIVSDDTGHPGRYENAPWLFTASTSGRLDDHPLKIQGLQEIRDLESITKRARGGYYALGSQSKTRKGKRPKERTWLLHLTVSSSGAQLVRRQSLWDALEDLGPEHRAPLGLESLEQLDVEGLTETATGSLLLGVKEPLTANGAALILELLRPESFLETGKLSPDMLRLWQTVELAPLVHGKATPGGISELLLRPSGDLWIAATVSGAEPERQDGRLYRLQGKSSPELLATFPGLKPEGLTESPQGKVFVLFDEGDLPPHYLELQ